MEVKKLETNSLTERQKELLGAFEKEYGESAQVLLRVPGRVNIIGEHIDYCGYAVHPMAIEQDLLVAGARDHQGRLSLTNLEEKYGRYEQESLTEITIPAGRPQWWAYFLCGLKGVLEERGLAGLGGVRLLVSGVIPPSAGLSSSSALVVSAALLAVWEQQIEIGREELANLCARSERYIGTQGGGMDQAIEILAEEGSAKLIEFAPLRTHNVKLPPGATFVVANSLEEKNKAASNDFNTRVVECRIAAKILAKKLLAGEEWRELVKLKDVQERVGVAISQMVDKVEAVLHQEDYTAAEVMDILQIDENFLKTEILTANTQQVETFRLYQRARHVYSEAGRVYQFREECEAGGEAAKSLARLGSLMTESHSSCSRLYQCSSTGLDTLVQLALEFGALGARLTGAGWGGCIVALVGQQQAELFIQNMRKSYYDNMGLTQTQINNAIFVTKPGAGATIWNI